MTETDDILTEKRGTRKSNRLERIENDTEIKSNQHTYQTRNHTN